MVELSAEERRIITEYRKLNQNAREDVTSYIVSLAARSRTAPKSGSQTCCTKAAVTDKGNKEEPIITE